MIDGCLTPIQKKIRYKGPGGSEVMRIGAGFIYMATHKPWWDLLI
jgi:hypothetical protein